MSLLFNKNFYRLVILIVVLVVVLISCKKTKVEPQLKGEIKNVILIVIDCARADHFCCYGYPRQTTPNIDKLASKGIIFKNAVTQAPWTIPSIASLFTFFHPLVHGVSIATSSEVNEKSHSTKTQIIISNKLNDKFFTLAERLQRKGITTIGFYNNIHLTPEFGYSQGFDIWLKFIKWSNSPEITGHVLEWLNNPIIINDNNFNLIQANNLVKDIYFKNLKYWPNIIYRRRSRDHPHSGKFSVHISKKEMMQAKQFYSLVQEIPVKPRKKYIFGAYLKTENLSEEALVSIEDARGSEYGFEISFPLSKNSPWTPVWGAYTSSPTTRRIKLRIGRIFNFKTGDIWVSDPFLIEMERVKDKLIAKNFFLYIHYLDLHSPYIASSPYVELYKGMLPKGGDRAVPHGFKKDKHYRPGQSKVGYYINRYDGLLRSVDDNIGLIIEKLRVLGKLKNTLIIITADHGEQFAEHKGMGHGFLYNEVVKVPLVFYSPNLKNSGKTLYSIANLIDLGPTILDIFNINYKGLDGKSLLPLIIAKNKKEGMINNSIAYCEKITDEIIDFSVQTKEWKFIYRAEGQQKELYNLAKDPEETINVVANYPKIVKQLEQLLLSHIKECKKKRESIGVKIERMELDEETIKQLKALGYIQ